MDSEMRYRPAVRSCSQLCFSSLWGAWMVDFARRVWSVLGGMGVDGLSSVDPGTVTARETNDVVLLGRAAGSRGSLVGGLAVLCWRARRMLGGARDDVSGLVRGGQGVMIVGEKCCLNALLSEGLLFTVPSLPRRTVPDEPGWSCGRWSSGGSTDMTLCRMACCCFWAALSSFAVRSDDANAWRGRRAMAGTCSSSSLRRQSVALSLMDVAHSRSILVVISYGCALWISCATSCIRSRNACPSQIVDCTRRCCLTIWSSISFIRSSVSLSSSSIDVASPDRHVSSRRSIPSHPFKGALASFEVPTGEWARRTRFHDTHMRLILPAQPRAVAPPLSLRQAWASSGTIDWRTSHLPLRCGHVQST
eukprot:Sspe_Gene.54918::Locus_30255_Transcript_1_1_Confidence_1.000_Length_4369::g.54918::m.54918